MNGSGNALAVHDGYAPERQHAGALAIRADQTAWDKMQLAALGQLGLKGAPEGDLAVFLHVSQRMGLDPFARQIYMIKRREKIGKDDRGKDIYGDKWTIQTGIDGFRVNRARAERLAGVRGTLGRSIFYDRDGNEYKVWFRSDHPAACEITYTVRDATGETPYVSVLRFDEYAQSAEGSNGQRYLTGQWRTKGAHMLEKCTEADVYRKAFPQDFSGIVLDDAMPLPDPDAPPAQPERPRVTAGQARARAPQRVQAEVVDPGPSPTAAESPGSVPAAAPPADTAVAGEAPVTTATVQRIWDRLKELGVEERNYVRVASQVLGKPVKHASETDGRKVLDTLEGLDAAGLDGLRAEMAMAGDPARGDGE